MNATTKTAKVCIVLPALNEEATIAEVIERVPRDMDGVSEVSIVVVDDGSTDGTRAAATSAGAIVVSHPVNRGVGVAFRTGMKAALDLGADYVVNIDSDGQFAPEDIPKLLRPLLAHQADCVTASRFADKALTPHMSPVKLYGNHMMSALISLLVGKRYYDVSCGFRAYTRETLLQLNLMGDFTYTQETFMDLVFKRMTILEVPIEVRGTRAVGQSRVARSIPRYAYNTSKIIFRTFRDYYPLRVFGSIAAVFILAALALFAFLFVHYLNAGSFTPYKSVGFTAGYLGAVGVVLLVTAFLADMFVRVRNNQERILYLLKKLDLERRD